MSLLAKLPLYDEEQNPWAEDCLDAKKWAGYLTPVIGSITQPFVISLNAPYGAGKSFFIKNWNNDLTAQGFSTVYFNAWESDYTNTPLVAFISTIEAQLKDGVSKVSSLLVAGAGYIAQKKLATKACVLIAKGAAIKIIGADAVKELSELIPFKQDDVSEFASSLASDAMKEHKASTESAKKFKKELKALVDQISKKNNDKEKKKLIVFVDELDRCRPSYAIEVLECIKHLFDVPGVVFILAVDINQLKSTVMKTYGAPDDGEGYLRKFIDWQWNLPRPSKRSFIRYLFEKLLLKEVKIFYSRYDIKFGWPCVIRTVEMIAVSYKLSLRQLSHAFTEINLYARSLSEGSLPHAFCLGLFAPLRQIKDQKLLHNIIFDEERRLYHIKKAVKLIDPEFLVDFDRSETILINYIHALFLDKAEYTQLYEELRAYENGNALNTSFNETTKKKYDDLRGLSDAYKVLHATEENEETESIATIVYNRLEMASSFTGHSTRP